MFFTRSKSAKTTLCANAENKKGFQFLETLVCTKWELTGSNRRPSACKADALNQLS